MHLVAKVIRISRAKFHCNRLTNVQDIQDYADIIFRDTLHIFYIYRVIYNKLSTEVSL